MKPIKIFYFSFSVIMILLSLSGCVRDDSPYPDILNTTWTWSDENNENNSQLLSFTDKTVTHTIKEGNSTTVNTFDISKGSSFGEHYYQWFNEEREGEIYLYKVYSHGQRHILVGKELYSSLQEKLDTSPYYCFSKK